MKPEAIHRFVGDVFNPSTCAIKRGESRGAKPSGGTVSILRRMAVTTGRVAC